MQEVHIDKLGRDHQSQNSRVKINNLSKFMSSCKDLPEFLGSEQFHQKN